jgi:hypothetical protein
MAQFGTKMMVTKLSGHWDSGVQQNIMTSKYNNHYSTANLNLGPTSNYFAQRPEVVGKALPR